MRQAFGYSIDRVAIVKKLFGALGVDQPANSLNPFVVADYSDQNAWANYKLDLEQGQLADDRRRLEEEQRRHLGEERQDRLVHDRDDRRQQAA